MYRYIHLSETDSTNTYLKNLATDEAVCVIAERQTGGRGRRGRTFESPDGGLYMSFTCHSDDVLGDGLTAKTAVAVARAIEKLTGLSAGIKWVNDIYVNGRKLCGILAEGVWNDGTPKIVIGIGVNLRGALPAELTEIATTVEAEGGRIPQREELARAIIGEFLSCTDFRHEYKTRQTILGCPVTVHRGDESFDAVAEDIAEDFGIILRLPDNTTMTLSSGEVSLRRREYEE